MNCPQPPRGLESTVLDVPPNFRGQIAWLEASASSDAQPGVVFQRAIDRLRTHNRRDCSHKPSIISTHTIVPK